MKNAEKTTSKVIIKSCGKDANEIQISKDSKGIRPCLRNLRVSLDQHFYRIQQARENKIV